MDSDDKAAVWAMVLIIVSILIFGGEPDIQDAIVHYLMQK